MRVKVYNPAWGGPCEALATLLPCPEEIRIPYASSDAVALKGLLEPQAVGTAVPFCADGYRCSTSSQRNATTNSPGT